MSLQVFVSTFQHYHQQNSLRHTQATVTSRYHLKFQACHHPRMLTHRKWQWEGRMRRTAPLPVTRLLLKATCHLAVLHLTLLPCRCAKVSHNTKQCSLIWQYLELCECFLFFLRFLLRLTETSINVSIYYSVLSLFYSCIFIFCTIYQ